MRSGFVPPLSFALGSASTSRDPHLRAFLRFTIQKNKIRLTAER